MEHHLQLQIPPNYIRIYHTNYRQNLFIYGICDYPFYGT